MALEAVTVPRAPGILLGIGLGGFVDGILLHQILQWHHLLTSEGSYPKTTVAGLEANTLADGLFHAATWVAVAVGVYVLWRRTTDWRWAISGRAFFGWMLVGWGLFNVVEGVIDHHLLTLHHVREGTNINETAWDLGFLAFGALLLVGGWLLARSDDAQSPISPIPSAAAGAGRTGSAAPSGEPTRQPHRPSSASKTLSAALDDRRMVSLSLYTRR